jgi:SAM-dependent methyltransferase
LVKQGSMDDTVSVVPAEPLVVRHYVFTTPEACNMCGSPSGTAKTLGVRLDKSQGRNPRGARGIAVSVCRCTDCGLIYANPQPRPRSIADHYGLPPESYWKSVSTETPPGYFSREIATAKRLLNFEPGMKALDIGVGLGHAVQSLRAAGFDVSGIEPSEPFFNKARERLAMGPERLKLASVEEAEFEASSFDFVTFGAVLEHLYDPDAAIKAAIRWLKPGGVIQAEVPNANHLVSRIINGYYWAAGTSYVTHLSPMHVPFHLFEFTIDSFRKHAAANGCSVAEHWVEVASIYNIPRVLHPALRWWMARSETGMQLTVWLRKDE